jgi:hypothetical protein
MADHASLLMAAVEAVLKAQLPLTGGWRASRIETPVYPVGFINITASTPRRGQGYYGEDHRGVISVWTRAAAGTQPNPRQAFALCNDAHSILGQAPLTIPGLSVAQFACGAMTPQNPDGLTWGRSFIFTATTHEVNTNG